MKSPCLTPKCPNLASYRGRCGKCSKERDKSIHRAGRATYSTKRWHLTRRRKLGMNPICERCNKELSTDVHHRTSLADGGDQWAMDNLEACCHSCHSKATRVEQLQG